MEKKEIIIDLDELNESNLMLLGANIRYMLDSMFGGAPITAMIKGDRSKVNAFGRALSSEKRYMDAYIKHGLADARTHRSASKLKNAVGAFEKVTGLKWPVK
tara:strand:- start:160 stop:465 length:306 start_codon:yes stop_codon:yes gene_type:complete